MRQLPCLRAPLNHIFRERYVSGPFKSWSTTQGKPPRPRVILSAAGASPYQRILTRRALGGPAARTQHHHSTRTQHQRTAHSHRHRTKTSTRQAALLSATRRSRHTGLTHGATTGTTAGDTTRVHAASRTIRRTIRGALRVHITGSTLSTSLTGLTRLRGTRLRGAGLVSTSGTTRGCRIHTAHTTKVVRSRLRVLRHGSLKRARI